MKQNSTKTIPYCSFVTNKVKNINPSCNTTEFLNKKVKKGMGEAIRMNGFNKS